LYSRDVSLPELLARTFSDRANQVALEWACQEYTFADLDRRANRMAAALTARGLTRGDRLALYLPNRLEYIDLFLAATRLGLIVVPINVLYRERELGHIIGDATPKAVVAELTASAKATASPPQRFARRRKFGPTSAAPEWRVDELAAEAARLPATAIDTSALDDSTPAALIYTSGTTGPAKGAVITHGNLAANARNLVASWHITADDRFLLALPLFHAHGLGNGVHCWLVSGCRTRLLERFDRASAAETFLDFRPTLFFGVPTMYVRMLEIDDQVARKIGSRLRLCVSGSAPLPAQVLEDFDARFGQRILERYGMTETLMTLSNPYDGERRGGTVGKPLPGVEARVLNEDGTDVADGVTGELHVKSPTLFAAYWSRPDATKAAFRDSWFATGDLAVRSADGYYTLCGRRSDLIIASGFNVYPREIEELLAEHPAVAEVAVVGSPDPVKGEVPVAFVVPRPDAGQDSSALVAWCRDRLASFKVPREVRFLDALPRNAMGKVEKKRLI
jgi:malonyl-CoA/methylmalonyl-CoA synthetase